MTRLFPITFLACVSAVTAAADPLVYCLCEHCGGGGPRMYSYQVESPGAPVTELTVGMAAIIGELYDVLMPEGWHCDVSYQGMPHSEGVLTPRGEQPLGPCFCLTEGRLRWWTDDPFAGVESFMFGFNHLSFAEDVGWIMSTAAGTSYIENWDAPAGMGAGPIHGPATHDLTCDINCDGAVNVFDIDPFVLALVSAEGYAASFPGCDIRTADLNRDGRVDVFDIDHFIECMLE
jgi:hypothetical protein